MSSNSRKPQVLTRANGVSELYDPETGIFFRVRSDIVPGEGRPREVYPQGMKLAAAVQQLADGLRKSSRDTAEAILPVKVQRMANRMWGAWGRRSWFVRKISKSRTRREIFRRVLLAVIREKNRPQGER